MEKAVVDGSIIAIYFGLFFIFYMMFMFYTSLRFRLRELSRDMEYIRKETKETQNDIREMRYK